MIYNEKEYKAKIPYDRIDVEIRDIIKELNEYEGVATIDSCAGHIRNNTFENPSIGLCFWKYELLREFIMRFLLIELRSVWGSESKSFNLGIVEWENCMGVPERTSILHIDTSFTEKITSKVALENIRKDFFFRVKVVLKMLNCPLFQSKNESYNTMSEHE